MVELAPDLIAVARKRFATVLAQEMGYGKDAHEDLAAQLDVALDLADLRLRFSWCDLEMLSSLDDTSRIEGFAATFALNVADDLKEHRGRGQGPPRSSATRRPTAMPLRGN